MPMTGDLASRTRCFRIAARVFWQCANLELITPVWIEENESTEEFDLLGDSEAGADYRHRIMEASIRDLALQTDRVTSELLRETREGADRPSALARTIESLQRRRKYLLFGLKVEYAPELRKGR